MSAPTELLFNALAMIDPYDVDALRARFLEANDLEELHTIWQIARHRVLSVRYALIAQMATRDWNRLNVSPFRLASLIQCDFRLQAVRWIYMQHEFCDVLNQVPFDKQRAASLGVGLIKLEVTVLDHSAALAGLATQHLKLECPAVINLGSSRADVLAMRGMEPIPSERQPTNCASTAKTNDAAVK